MYACIEHLITNSLSLSPFHSLPLSPSPPHPPFSPSLSLPFTPHPILLLSPSLSPCLPPYQTVSEALPFHTDWWIGRKQFLHISNSTHSKSVLYYKARIDQLTSHSFRVSLNLSGLLFFGVHTIPLPINRMEKHN